MSSRRTDIIRQTFIRIKDDPSEDLSERSLKNFEAFWLGFTARAEDTSFTPAGFHDFVNAKYRNDTTHGAVSVVTLYSKNAAEAWDKYFELLDEYKSVDRSISSTTKLVLADNDTEFCELLRALIQRPAMYLGTASFRLAAEFIDGWLVATKTLGYVESNYERRFGLLLKYIEEFDINLPGPPWHSIVWFHSMNDKDAFELFSGYVEEFVTQQKGWIERIEHHLGRRLNKRRD